jgi:hypothetical protein
MSSDHCYPVVGISASSKLMSDIQLQFHQEAESIDLLGIAQGSSSTSFFHQYQSQYQELLLQHQQKLKNEELVPNTAPSSANNNNASATPYSTRSRVNVSSTGNHRDGNNNDTGDVSESSSMMMTSMDSSINTSILSP